MSRIAVFTDIHGNIEALKAIYKDIQSEGITDIYHLGDALAIGPRPKETIDFLLDHPIVSLKGNHEIYYTDIVATGTTDINASELKHQLWVAKSLGPSYYNAIDHLKYEHILTIEGLRVLMCHYPYIMENGRFKWFIDLGDSIDHQSFTKKDIDLYLYGHQHHGGDYTDSEGRRYVNLMSSGATKDQNTSYTILDVHDRSYNLIKKIVPYDHAKVIEELNTLLIPERDFIKKVFFGVVDN